MNKIRTLIITLLSILLLNKANAELLTLIPLESDEQQIIAQMATTPFWEDELHPALAIDAYKQFLKAKGFRIEHSEVHREIVLPADLQTWLFQKVLPSLNLSPSRQADFIEDFLSYLDPNTPLIQRKLVLKVGPSDKIESEK